MSQKTVTVPAETPIETGDVFTVHYPEDYTSADFAPQGHYIFPRALQAVFFQDEPYGIDIAFSPASVSITYLGRTTIPIGTYISCNLSLLAAGEEVPPVFSRDFAADPISTDGLTVTRAGTWYALDSTGTWLQFPADTPRRTDLGLLGESARTNGIKNSTMQGGATGTPGTQFTNWLITGSANGLVRTIGQKGVLDDGLTTADTQYVGDYTPANVMFIRPMAPTEVVAAPGDTITVTWWVEPISGAASANEMDFEIAISECAAGVEITGGRHSVHIPLSAGTVGANKFIQTAILTKATVTSVATFLEFGGTGSTLGLKDFNIRYACQMEQGGCSTSPIPTTTVAVTRPEDVITEPFTSTSSGSIRLVATAPDGTLDATILSISDGTSANRVDLYRDSVGFIHARIVVASATTVDLIAGQVLDSAQFDLFFAWEPGEFSIKLDEEALQSKPGALPPSLNTLRYAGGPLGNWNSTVQSVAVYDYKVDVDAGAPVIPYLSAASFGQFPIGYVLATAGKELRQEINWYVNGAEPMSELIWTATGWYSDADNLEYDLGNDQTIRGFYHIPAFSALIPMTFGGNTTGTILNGTTEFRADPLLPSMLGLAQFPPGMVWSARTARLVPTGGKHPATTIFGFFDDDAVEGPPGAALQINGTGPLTATGGSTITNNYQRAPVILGLGVP